LPRREGGSPYAFARLDGEASGGTDFRLLFRTENALVTWSRPVVLLSLFALGAPTLACLVLIQVDPGISGTLVTEFVKIMVVCGVLTGLVFAFYLNKAKID
jgi:hypothetical protein